MNIGISEAGGALSKPTKNELELLVAGVQAGWQTEHQVDGTHTGPVERLIDPLEFFTTSGATNWVVPAIDGQTFLCRVRGGCMWIQFFVYNTQISGTPTTLYILIPDGWISVDNAVTMGWAVNGGDYRSVMVEVVKDSPSNTRIKLQRVPVATWADDSFLSVGFSFEFRVRRP